MLKLYFILLVLIMLISFGECLPKQFKSNRSLQVRTSGGIVQGRRALTFDGTPYWAYQGIPYAKPPLGDLRFKSPVPNEPWQGVLDATSERSGCLETYADGSTGISTWGQEDCLFVNVYTSRNPKTIGNPLPVLVWMYGGAFAHGNSSTKFYGVDNLIKQDMVIVMFNYRIGILGFMSTEDLASPGNYGLKDQLLVLKWIQQNINNFGGDKNRVTLFGQSAGAASVMYHMASPKSAGLFHRVIASSGSPLCLWAYSRNSKKVAFDIATAAGIKTKNTKELVRQLKKYDIRDLKRISKLVTVVNAPELDKFGFGFGPIIEPPHEDAFLTQPVFDIFESGKFNKVPVIMGMTNLETALFTDAISLLRPIIFRYDLSPGTIPNPAMNIRTFEENREAGCKIKKRYFKDTIVDSSVEELLMYTTDEQFVRPLTKTAQLLWKYVPVHFYIFSYSSNYGVDSLKALITNRAPLKGVAHVEEQWYIWKRQGLQLSEETDKLVSARVLRLWRNFMESGNPTPVQDSLLQNVIWPRISSSNNITQLVIDSDLELTQNYRWEYMQFWEKLYKQYGHKPYLSY